MERQLLLLGLLRREDMHGYRLNEFIERDLAFCTDVKKPTAYYLLDKLADQGYIREVEDPTGADSSRPPRTTYSITPAGEAHFMELLRDNLSHFERHTFPGDIGIAFMDALPREEAIRRLEERRQAMQAFLTDMEQVPPHQGPLNLVVDHHVRHMQAEIDWLDGVLSWLESAVNSEQDEASSD
jgi:DNA-binding PadR family transcriptional regulator